MEGKVHEVQDVIQIGVHTGGSFGYGIRKGCTCEYLYICMHFKIRIVIGKKLW
jgi:hypothetical protein